MIGTLHQMKRISLRDQDPHHAAVPAHKAPGDLIWHIVVVFQKGLDLPARFRIHPGLIIDDSGHRAGRYTSHFCNVVNRHNSVVSLSQLFANVLLYYVTICLKKEQDFFSPGWILSGPSGTGAAPDRPWPGSFHPAGWCRDPRHRGFRPGGGPGPLSRCPR